MVVFQVAARVLSVIISNATTSVLSGILAPSFTRPVRWLSQTRVLAEDA
jgi:hypothetical protein